MKKAIELEEKGVKGNLTKVYNKGKYMSANSIYYHLNAGGQNYLFTKSQLQEAKERAIKNKEDLADIRGTLEKILDKIFG